MWDNIIHKRLRDICAYLWPDSRDCRRLVQDSLIDSSKINWDEPPSLRWQSVIMECEKQGTLPKLVLVLLKDYPENKALKEACEPWLSEEPKEASTEKPVLVALVVPADYIDSPESIPITLESIRQDLAYLSRELFELIRWRTELATMSSKTFPKGTTTDEEGDRHADVERRDEHPELSSPDRPKAAGEGS